jgi:RES domain-containing protein
MITPAEWDGRAAVERCRRVSFRGAAWRAHKRRYSPLDDTGTRIVSGRYHRAPDQFPPSLCWSALYLALAPEIALGEIIRHMTPESFPALDNFRITEVSVVLLDVLDCRDPAVLGIPLELFWDDYAGELPQALARAALEQGVEALQVPSATRMGDNLVVFTENLRPESKLLVVGGRDPHLVVPR